MNTEGKVTNKHINLFDESNDSFRMADAEKYLGKLNLIIQDSSADKSAHYISSQRILEDKEAGVSVQVNEARQDEVQSISWFQSQGVESKVGGR